MTEVSSCGLRVPRADQPRILRILAFLQELSCLVTIVIGLIVGMVMLYFFAPMSTVTIVLAFAYAKIGLGISDGLSRREKAIRKSHIVINIAWILVLTASIALASISSGVLLGHLETFQSLVQYLGAGLLMPVLILIILNDPQVKSDFV